MLSVVCAHEKIYMRGCGCVCEFSSPLPLLVWDKGVCEKKSTLLKQNFSIFRHLSPSLSHSLIFVLLYAEWALIYISIRKIDIFHNMKTYKRRKHDFFLSSSSFINYISFLAGEIGGEIRAHKSSDRKSLFCHLILRATEKDRRHVNFKGYRGRSLREN